LSIVTDAVEKGFDFIVVPFDAVFNDCRLMVGIGIEVDATTTPTPPTQAFVLMAARGSGAPAF